MNLQRILLPLLEKCSKLTSFWAICQILSTKFKSINKIAVRAANRVSIWDLLSWYGLKTIFNPVQPGGRWFTDDVATSGRAVLPPLMYHSSARRSDVTLRRSENQNKRNSPSEFISLWRTTAVGNEALLSQYDPLPNREWWCRRKLMTPSPPQDLMDALPS
jgi:hypothetical protein